MIEIKISIYQINSDRDKNNMLFMSHDTLEKYQGYPYVDSSIYDKIYQKDVDCKMLETVFNKFNIDRPSDFKGHSLSVSDIIEVVTSNSVEPGFYFCDRFGFKKVEFDPDKTQVSAKINTPKPMIDVLLVEPKKYPKMIKIENTLEAKQYIVGGYIEQYTPFNDNVAIICNEEGKMLNLPLNRAIYTEPKEIELPYNELKEMFRQAERTKKSIIGYVVFTKDSFTKDYTEEERTYVVSSNNKAFIDGMGGYSIYASSLDGSDTGVRIERYMADELGEKDGWKIERCYIKDDSNREMLDIIAGKFIVCYAPPESENYQSLPDKLAKKYEEKFKLPEKFAKINNEIVAIPFKPNKKEYER